MRTTLPDPESLDCFVVAAEQLNFRATARVVGLTPAAVGQRIRRLEEQLDVRLFERTTRRVTLTRAGRDLLPQAQRALHALATCGPAAHGERGMAPEEVTLGTRHELGLSWLLPLIDKLEDAHPQVTFHVYFGSGGDLEDRVRARDIDCAISSRRLGDPRLRAVRLHLETYTFCAAPALLADRPFAEPEQSSAHTLFDVSRDLSLFQYFWNAPGAPRTVRFAETRIVSTIAGIERLLHAGRGVAVLPTYLVADALAEGALVALFPDVALLSDHFRLFFRAADPRRALYESMGSLLLETPLC